MRKNIEKTVSGQYINNKWNVNIIPGTYFITSKIFIGKTHLVFSFFDFSQ